MIRTVEEEEKIKKFKCVYGIRNWRERNEQPIERRERKRKKEK